MTDSPLLTAGARHAAILDALRARGQVRAVTMADELGVTHETVRKDLVVLESNGLLRRVHGGALPVDSLAIEPSVTSRTEMAAAKKQIAQAALALVPTKGALLFDSGTTTLALAGMLPRGHDCVAITNSLPVGLALMAHPRLTVHQLGGRVRPETLASADAWALRDLAEVRADVAFIGTNAVSIERGLSTPDSAEAAVKRAIVGAADLRVLLADHTKFGRSSVFTFAALTDIDVVVTDAGLSAKDARELESVGGIEVIRAAP